MPRRTRRPAVSRPPRGLRSGSLRPARMILRTVSELVMAGFVFARHAAGAVFLEWASSGLRGPGRNFSRTWVLDKLAPELLSSLLSAPPSTAHIKLYFEGLKSMGNEPSHAARITELLGRPGSAGTLASSPVVPDPTVCLSAGVLKAEAERACDK